MLRTIFDFLEIDLQKTARGEDESLKISRLARGAGLQ